MHTIKEIIDNQKNFKEQITAFLNKEHTEAKRELNRITTEDEFILNEKKKLEGRFKKIKIKNYIGKLFFMHSSRNENFYVWWDSEQNEAVILRYG